MDNRLVAGIGTRCVQFAQHAHLPTFNAGTHQQHAQATVAQVGLFGRTEHEALFAWRLVEAEELCEGHGDAFEQFFQGTDRGADAVLLDLGDRRVCQPATTGQLPLGEFVAFTHQFESCPRVHSRLIYRKFFGGALKHIP
ncbi:hypothetical protein D3C85_1507260 [compost metagenome]